MTDAVGPIFAAGFQHVTKTGWEILYLPDLHNDELQREGKAPVYWWLPNEVRLARKNGDQGDFKFSFIHFEGVRSGSTNIGVEGTNEVAGGLLAFSTTTAPPAGVLQESQDELLNRFRGNDDKYWGWRTPVAPMFRPAPIVSNTTTITNLSPTADGQAPAVGSPGGATPAVGGAGGGPPGGRGLDPMRPPSMSSRSIEVAHSRPPSIRTSDRIPIFRSPKGSVQLRDVSRGAGLDMWYANLQGQGSGSVSPFAENAYSGLVGSLPAALIWTSFHTGTGGISVWQKMKIKVWSPVVHLHIEGDWDRVQDHFSAAAHGGGLFWSADVQAEFNSMRMDGTIQVVVEVDTTLPNADKLQEEIDKRTDLVFQKFMDQAQKVIFDPAPYTEKPAEASGGFLGFGGGGAVKLRRDQTHLHLAYDERREMAYLQDYPVSGQLEGLYDELKADPTSEKKYFVTLYLSDWERKVTRVFKPVVNYSNTAQEWVGQPVAFLSAQSGYPNTEGVIQWDGHIFQSTDPPDAVWTSATEMKAAADVKNPPSGWTPDKTFIKRQVHFTEPPNETENPFVRIQVEKNVVDLDPGDLGRPVDDINLEIRVDNVGGLNVGPILLNVDLEDAKQVVEVTFQAAGKTDAGNDRPPVKFDWHFDDQTKERYWMVFTGQPDFIPRYTYQVRVLVKGSIFTKGQEWIGPIQEMSGNGPVMVSVPTPTDPGVVTRELKEEHVVVVPPAKVHVPPPAERARAAAKVPAYAGAKASRGADAGSKDAGWSLTPPKGGGTKAAPTRGTGKGKASARGPGKKGEDASEMFSSFSPAPPEE